MFCQPGKIIKQLQESENEFRKIQVFIDSGQDAFQLIMNGLQEVVETRFGANAHSLLAKGQLARLISETFNEALRESRRQLKEEITRLTGVKLPHIPGII